MLFGIFKWIFALVLSFLFIIAIGSTLDLFTEGTCFQISADFIINKFFPGGYFYD